MTLLYILYVKIYIMVDLTSSERMRILEQGEFIKIVGKIKYSSSHEQL